MGRTNFKSHGGPRKPLAIRLREGVRVNVLLPKENRWFTGAVFKYDTKKALHTIVNDFGEAKRVDLRAVKWKLDGIDECTEADIEAALDKGRRWHKSQSAEFLEAMSSPTISPREGTKKNSEEGEGSAWDTGRLRARKEHKDWCSSSEGDSGGNGEVCSMGDEDDYGEADTASFDPPALMKISNSGHGKSGHLDFELGDADEESMRDFCGRFGSKQRGRKKPSGLGPEGAVLKRPVGRPPKERKGYAAVKYAQDVAARAINKMAKDKLCNFNVIPSSIPFVEELQLIFGISRRLKVEKQRLATQGTEESAPEVFEGYHIECGVGRDQEGEEGGYGLELAHRESPRPMPAGIGSIPVGSSPMTQPPSPLQQSPSCAVRETWHQGFHSSLVV